MSRLIFFPKILVVNWKPNWCDSLVLKSSSLKVMMLLFSRSIAPSAVNKFFHCAGQVWTTSRVNIAHGAWSKYSTMFYYWETCALGLIMILRSVLLGGWKIALGIGFSIWIPLPGGGVKVEGLLEENSSGFFSGGLIINQLLLGRERVFENYLGGWDFKKFIKFVTMRKFLGEMITSTD